MTNVNTDYLSLLPVDYNSQNSVYTSTYLYSTQVAVLITNISMNAISHCYVSYIIISDDCFILSSRASDGERILNSIFAVWNASQLAL